MFFSKSIAFDEDGLSDAAAAARADASAAELDFVEKLRAGDVQAFDTLVRRYADDVYALLCRLTDDRDEAGDLTQETFLSALKSIKSFRGDSGIKTWLFRIAVNSSRNRFRWWNRRGRNKTFSLDATIGGSEMRIEETLASAMPGPEDTAIAREREIALRKALAQLPVVFRTVIVLCDIEGMAYDDIAHVLGLNLGTVKSRIARGRRELRAKLKGL